MNLQTIRQLEDALAAFGAGKNVTVEMSAENKERLRPYLLATTSLGPLKQLIVSPFRVVTPGGFVITVIEKT